MRSNTYNVLTKRSKVYNDQAHLIGVLEQACNGRGTADDGADDKGAESSLDRASSLDGSLGGSGRGRRDVEVSLGVRALERTRWSCHACGSSERLYN